MKPLRESSAQATSLPVSLAGSGFIPCALWVYLIVRMHVPLCSNRADGSLEPRPPSEANIRQTPKHNQKPPLIAERGFFCPPLPSADRCKRDPTAAGLALELSDAIERPTIVDRDLSISL